MNTKRKKVPLWLWIVVTVIVLVPVLIALIKRFEGTDPVIQLQTDVAAIGASRQVTGVVSDRHSGIRRLWIGLIKDGKETVLLDKTYPGSQLLGKGEQHQADFEITIKPSALGLSDGQGLLRLAAWDYSWRGWWKGNRTYIEKTVQIDTRPPEITVISHQHNISQGGSGLVIYRLSEECPVNGVVVGDNFFPGHAGYFKDTAIHLAYFALGQDQSADTEMFLRAADRAGNTRRAGFYHYIRKQRFPKDRIHLSDRFLSWKMPEFNVTPAGDSGEDPLLSKFLLVNREVRKANYETIAEVTANTQPRQLWQGRFEAMPGAKAMAGFAERRDYIYKGKKVDHQVHLGLDLAKVGNSPVPAANSGRVVFARRLGIYGNTIIIDHGFGLFSLYAHLSQMGVEQGQDVRKEEIIGHTGTTGMAGGDHLHFSILVHNTFVNPLEWMDADWIENNITAKLDDARAQVN